MQKKLGLILVAILAVSAFSLVASAYALPFINFNTVPANATSKVQQSYVRMDGVVTGYGSSAATGIIQAQSQTTIINSTTTKQGYSCTALWSTNTSRPITAVRARENFTYSFYSARLVSGNYSALDYNGNSFFINGTWNVWSVTETVSVYTNSTTKHILSINGTTNAVPLATDAYGTLTVPTGWNTFTLTITGVNPIAGKVTSDVITSRMFNPLVLSTDSDTTTVTAADLQSIVNAYGSMPGWGNYSIHLDPSLHYKIDICDLSTAAANLNTA